MLSVRKSQSMKVSDYFEIIKPNYRYIKITSHKNIKNFKSENIAKTITHMYKGINRRLRVENKKLLFESNYKIGYMVDILCDNIQFYFIAPSRYTNIIIEKIKEIWNKSTIEVLEDIEGMGNCETYEVGYRKEDALSLNITCNKSELLNTIVKVADVMKDEDRIRVVYNFMPTNQNVWIDRYSETIDKVNEGKSVNRSVLNFENIIRNGLIGVTGILDTFIGVINDFTGGNSKDDKKYISKIFMDMFSSDKLCMATKKKKDIDILNTQIIVQSYSKDEIRKINNGISCCQSFRILDEDNELTYKRFKKNIDILDYNYNTSINTMSCNEISNFIQIPNRDIIKEHKVDCVNIEESKVVNELKDGYFRIGTNTYKGNNQLCYLENDYNMGNLPLVVIGRMGSGKSVYMENCAKDCINNNESIIVLDFIGGCKLSENISKYVSSDRLIKLDLSKRDNMQGFGYNELKINKNMDNFKIAEISSKQSQQILNLVDSISVGDRLSGRMRRFLSSASKISFAMGKTSLKDVVECLEDYVVRKEYINSLNSELKELFKNDIRTLGELDSYTIDKVSKENVLSGTNNSKIEHILDRIYLLREDFLLQYMYEKDCSNNIDLVKCMNSGKVVLIQMRDSDFSGEMVKNILITYWISKIWLSSQLRGDNKPLRCNLFVDELFQAPTSMKLIDYMLPQTRKYGLHSIFSGQYMEQYDSIFKSLEGSGSSFMLLKGCNESDFNHFKNKMGDFEYEDLCNMKEFSSLNLITYSEGYCSFISKLPYDG